jgi:hypothetical protein
MIYTRPHRQGIGWLSPMDDVRPGADMIRERCMAIERED